MKGIKIGIVLCLTMIFIGGCINKKPAIPETPDAIVKYSKELPINPESVWADQSLKKSFAKYWGLRFARKSENALKMEAPHFQVMANPNRYRDYVKGFVEGLSEITISNREQKSERLIVIYFSLKTDQGDVSFVDPWVFAGEQWYHVMIDPIIFPETN